MRNHTILHGIKTNSRRCPGLANRTRPDQFETRTYDTKKVNSKGRREKDARSTRYWMLEKLKSFVSFLTAE